MIGNKIGDVEEKIIDKEICFNDVWIMIFFGYYYLFVLEWIIKIWNFRYFFIFWYMWWLFECIDLVEFWLLFKSYMVCDMYCIFYKKV